jgi:hypothetical protein
MDPKISFKIDILGLDSSPRKQFEKRAQSIDSSLKPPKFKKKNLVVTDKQYLQ